MKFLILQKIRPYIKNSLSYRRVTSFLTSNILKFKLRKQLHINKLFIEREASKKKILIPLIETSHYQFYQVALIAKALELRGAEVKFLVCDETLPGCEIKSIRNTKKDPCLNCRINRKNILPEFGLNTFSFSDVLSTKKIESIQVLARYLSSNYPESYKYYETDIIHIVNDSVIRYFYGGVPEEPSYELDEIRYKYLVTVLTGFETSKGIYDTWCPDIVFGNMEVYADWAPYHNYFLSSGAESCTVSMSQFNFKTLLMNQNDLYRSNKRYLTWLDNRNSSYLNQNEKQEIEDFVLNRFKGDSEDFKQYGYFDENNLAIQALNIDKNKKNIFLFSNVYWDVGMSEFGELYDGVLEWVISTIHLIKESPDIHLYIKPHPSEKFDVRSSKGVIDFIYSEFAELPSNVTIISPEMKILTYDLFKYIDIGLVYNGTLGLEMLFKDIPVVACGKTPYGGIDLVSEPQTKDDYKNILLGKIDLCKPSRKSILQFAYFYFIKTLIPWNFTENAYGNDPFTGFKMKSLQNIMPNEDYHLDHICTTILNSDKKNIDTW
jgi:hypothetical protein